MQPQNSDPWMILLSSLKFQKKLEENNIWFQKSCCFDLKTVQNQKKKQAFSLWTDVRGGCAACLLTCSCSPESPLSGADRCFHWSRSPPCGQTVVLQNERLPFIRNKSFILTLVLHLSSFFSLWKYYFINIRVQVFVSFYQILICYFHVFIILWTNFQSF